MAVKYLGNNSTGTQFSEGETRTVNVTSEQLNPTSGYEGDSVTYTATVLDSTSAKLPASFVASLQFGGSNIITDQAFDAGHYNQSTGLLTLTFNVPAGLGNKTVQLIWSDQVI